MTISGVEEYGLRCVLELARQFGKGTPMAASKIAEKEGMSVEYVRKFMFFFGKTGLVKAIRGIRGGFVLAKPPQHISLKQIRDTFNTQKSFPKTFCNQFPGHLSHCVHLSECSIRPIWSSMLIYFDALLNGISLADLLQQEQDLPTIVRERLTIILKKSESQKREAYYGNEHQTTF